ncbi:MAG: hypothetical protein K2L11_01825 [Muribaculaceae bacterium]|nr:hypothetical protein [Muribaculaceae bacterium]
MDKDTSVIIGVIGLVLLMLRFNGGFLPTAIRLIGSAMLVFFGYIYFGGPGLALVIGGLLTLGTSYFTIRKRFDEITIYDGIAMLVGLIETIVGFVIGI